MMKMPRAFPGIGVIVRRLRQDPRRDAVGHGEHFRLLRYFAIASFIAIVLAAAGIGVFFRHTALKQVVRLGEDNNVALAHALSATLRPHYAPLIGGVSGLPGPAATRLHEAVVDAVRETRIVRIAIYDAAGRTLYSSAAHVPGADSGAAARFSAARSGIPSTRLNHADAFDASGLMLAEGSVLTSQVPVTRPGFSEIEAVFELASDVTPFREQIRRTQTELRYALAAVVILLYGALFFVARRAEAVIAAQDEQRSRDADTIRHLAHHDALTGLPNRKLFGDRLSCAVERAKRGGHMAALMFVDLDHFKEINDTHGHAVGDRVLQAAGTLLRDSLRTSDTVARMGGDEFTIILEDVADLDRVETVARKIAGAFAAPVIAEEGGLEIVVTPSIGIALYPVDGNDTESLLGAADAAMYEAKSSGRNAYRFRAARATTRMTSIEAVPIGSR